MAQTDRHTHGHGDSMTNSAQWGRVVENTNYCKTIFLGQPLLHQSVKTCLVLSFFHIKKYTFHYQKSPHPHTTSPDQNCDRAGPTNQRFFISLYLQVWSITALHSKHPDIQADTCTLQLIDWIGLGAIPWKLDGVGPVDYRPSTD